MPPERAQAAGGSKAGKGVNLAKIAMNAKEKICWFYYVLSTFVWD
jgi:hypothetical protein